MKKTIILMSVIFFAFSCKKETEKNNGSSPQPVDTTVFNLTISNGDRHTFKDVNAVYHPFDSNFINIYSDLTYTTKPRIDIIALPLILTSGDIYMDTIGNPLAGAYSLNVDYKKGLSNYSMRYPQTITIISHDTVSRNIKGSFDAVFQQSASDTLLIQGDFNVFYN